MARLSELLGRSVATNLGLRDVLDVRERESAALRDVMTQAAQQQAQADIAAAQQVGAGIQQIGAGIGAGIQQQQQQLLQRQKAQAEEKRFKQQFEETKRQFDVGTALDKDKFDFQVGQSRNQLNFKIHELEQRTDLNDRELQLKKDLMSQQKELAIMKIGNDLRGGILKTKEQQGKAEDTLRKEFNPMIKDFQTVKSAQNKIESSIQQANATGDFSAIFALMKVLDPGSTVREGEFDKAKKTVGLPGQVVVWLNQIQRGEMLKPSQRQEFLNTSRNLFKAETDNFTTQFNRVNSIVQNRNLDPVNIFGKETLESFLGQEEKVPEGQEEKVPETQKPTSTFQGFKLPFPEGLLWR